LNTFPNIDFEENNPDANQKLIKQHYYILLAFVEFYNIKLQNRELQDFKTPGKAQISCVAIKILTVL